MVLLSGMNRSVWHCEWCFTFCWALTRHGSVNSNQCDMQMKAVVFSGSLYRQFYFLCHKFYSSSIFIEWKSLVKKAAIFSFILLQTPYEKHSIIHKVW